MKWTKEWPDKNGWYWYKDSEYKEPVIVEVRYNGSWGIWFNESKLGVLGDYSERFAGPIRMPK
jgi:hypothetical protein